jgi:hypothetical protein
MKIYHFSINEAFKTNWREKTKNVEEMNANVTKCVFQADKVHGEAPDEL